MRKVASEPEDPEQTGGHSYADKLAISLYAVSPHELSPLPDRTLIEVTETVGRDSGTKQRWYRVDDALCRQVPAEGFLFLQIGF